MLPTCLASVFVAFYYGNLTHPSQDHPRVGLLSTVPSDAAQRLQAAVQLANATHGGNFPGAISFCCQTATKVSDVVVVTSEAAPSDVPPSSGADVAGVPQAHSTPPSQISHISEAISKHKSSIGVGSSINALYTTLALQLLCCLA
jgi:hypothetical protein